MIVVSVVSAIALTGLVVAALVFGPAAYRALVPQVADGDLTITLRGDGHTAEVPVPAGWSYRVPFDDDAGIDLLSPNGAMDVALRVTGDVDPAHAIEEVYSDDLGAMSAESTEVGELLHARAVSEDAVVGALVAGSTTLTFVSSAAPEYDAELAQLLAAIAVNP